jgi:hypothetical protein
MSSDADEQDEAVVQEREVAAEPDVEPVEETDEAEGLEEEVEEETEEKESEKIEDRLDEKQSNAAAPESRSGKKKAKARDLPRRK